MFPVNALRPTTSHVADERLRLADAGSGSVCVSAINLTEIINHNHSSPRAISSREMFVNIAATEEAHELHDIIFDNQTQTEIVDADAGAIFVALNFFAIDDIAQTFDETTANIDA